MELSSLANSWVDSYLEALLSAGLSTEFTRKASEAAHDASDEDNNIAAKYYVHQIMSMEEDAIRQAWLKVSNKSRFSGDKDARLEFLSWRVWGMKRKRATVQQQQRAVAAAAGVASGSDDGADDLPAPDALPRDEGNAEEIAKLYKPPAGSLRALHSSWTETADAPDAAVASPVSPGSPGPLQAAVEASLTADRVPKLYCVLISMHGLVRGERMELGRDPDTGGQVKYVVELAKALAEHPAVHRVDLLTRLIADPKVDASYSVPEEPLMERSGILGGAYIVRLPCGPVNVYLKKERLWPYLREFADNAVQHVASTMARLVAVGEPTELYAIHGHYGDAGEAAALVSFTLGADMVLTGHSLGRNKLEHLLAGGSMSRREIEATYAISRRIEAEERSLDAAVMVFTSTRQEIRDQWGLYDGYNQRLERVVHQRGARGRHVPIMHVIPPGLDFSSLKVAPNLFQSGLDALTVAPRLPRISTASQPSGCGGDDGNESHAAHPPGGSPTHAGNTPTGLSLPTLPLASNAPSVAASPKAGYMPSPLAAAMQHEDPPIWQEIFRFLRNPRKPVILAMSRPDAKKNITTLVKAYGSNRVLREIANLVLIMGNREVIDSMAPGSAKVLDTVLKLIDAYDLYGHVAYPKHHTQSDISDIYLLPAATRGVFVNIALQEPFGLTLIEAAAHGVPIVATCNGGPVDIVSTLHNGVTVEPTNVSEVASQLLGILTSSAAWDEYSAAGLANISFYSWPSHCARYLGCIQRQKNTVVHRRKRTMRATFSACLDDIALLAEPPTAAPPSEDDGGAPAPGPTPSPLLRAGSGTTARVGSLDDLALATAEAAPPLMLPAPALAGAELADVERSCDSAPSLARERGMERSLTTTSMPMDGGASVVGSGTTADSPTWLTRRRYVVFMLDSADGAPQLPLRHKALLRKAGGGGTAGSGIGIGVASNLSLSDTAALLGAAGLGLSDIDFAITNCGSEIWYCGRSSEPTLDEAYEASLDAKWDLRSVRRVLAQMLDKGGVLQGIGGDGPASAAAGAAAAVTALGVSAAAQAASTGRGRLSLDLARNSSIDLGIAARLRVMENSGAHHQAISVGAVRTDEQLSLVGRLKRRFRRGGWRVQIVAQIDTPAAMRLHITPLPASRALALRWLALRHRVDLSSLILVCFPCGVGDAAAAAAHAPSGGDGGDAALAAAAGAGGGAGAGLVARFASSDAEDLVSGLPEVWVVPPLAGGSPGADGFPVDLRLYQHDQRVKVL